MCPMCEKRAQLLLRQQAVVESTPASCKPSSTDSSTVPDKASLFRNPFKACKHLTHQCCNPRCESQRTSIASGRRSSTIAPVACTPEHSGELSYIVSESPLSAESKDHPEPQQDPQAGSWPPLPKPTRRKGLLTRLKALTHAAEPKVRDDLEPSSTESSFGACRRKVTAVADELDQEEAKAPPIVIPSLATLLAAETDFEGEDDSMRTDVSVAVTETNVSETTILSMMNLNGSFSSPYGMTTSNRGSTLKSSAYDDDASSFAVVPRTSMNSSFLGRGGASDTSGLSDRFGELDIGYLSLEESGEGPEFDDTVSISSEQSEHLELEVRHAQDDTVSESDLDQEYSISTDSQEWVAETDDAASVLQHSRTHHTLHRQISPPPLPRPPSDPEAQQPPLVKTPKLTPNPKPSANKTKTLVVKKDAPPPQPKSNKTAKLPPPPERPCTEYLCSRCGRKESSQQQQTTKKVTSKANPMSTFFKTFMGDEEQAVMAAKVVVLLGKYGNRKGLRVSGLSPQQQQQQQQHQTTLSVKELNRLRTIMCPKNDAVSAFQNEVARMMLEGVDVPELNMDVEQFIAGYMKLNSPFYIDLIQDFFKSVCINCFGHMESVTGAARRRAPTPPRPAYAVLKPRKTKTIAGRGHNKLLQ